MSRALTFWNDATIKLIKQNFIAVSVPTWVCRSKTPEGEFLRRAGIDKHWVTSSGYMNCVSASGKFLGGQPSAKVLDACKQLPESQRKAGAVTVANLPPLHRAILSPPAGGLVLKVHARFLSRTSDGKLCHAKTTDFPLMQDKPNVMSNWQRFLHPNTEYMWITRDEWKALVPTNPAKGQQQAIDPIIAYRMARFHLTPQRATTSEGGTKSKQSVKTSRLTLTTKTVSQQHLTMVLKGFVHWGSDYDKTKATTPNGLLKQGFETSIYGLVEYDRMKKVFTKFNIVAPGHVWGRWGDANGKSMYVERPGRSPFGFAFELATGNSPTDRIPPGGNPRTVTQRTGYFSDAKK